MVVSESLPESGPFTQNSAAFLQWFNDSPGTRQSRKIHLADLRSQNAGRGVGLEASLRRHTSSDTALVASQDIAEDEELFAVPGGLVLTATTSEIPRQILEEIDRDDAWLPLIVTIIYEYLRQDASFWYPYFQVLPDCFNTLMFWSENELAELEASAVISKIGKAEAEEKWNKTIVPLMLKYADFFPVGAGDEDSQRKELVRLAHQAGSLIMAYAFDIDREEDDGTVPDDSSEKSSLVEDEEESPLKGMVPFADMLNADADKNNARLFQEEGYLIMKAIKPITAGQEIFNDYGPLPRSDLLRMYGYITDNYSQYDVVEVSYDLILKVAKSYRSDTEAASWERLAETIEEHDLVEEGYIISRPRSGMSLENAISGQLHMLLRVICGGAPRSRDWTDDDSTSKFPFTTREATLLSAILTERLSEYPTDIVHDRQVAVAKGVRYSGNLSDFKRGMALEVRLGEKEIYHAVLQMCEDHIKHTFTEASNGRNKHTRDENGSPPRKSRKLAHTEKKRTS